ncbi:MULTISPECIES: ATP-grasp ribosomal peptide maturase [unclassified Streptomyces]|uniref:ATP-grasp ribosomal peptide maturase n=1 Tax=unclassified Streptomyces TaxID=2593676 RepID=UPI0020246030|nr:MULTISPECIES: ATP-grasp ribosomal peptide maturase [unclassified Streptomyces]MCX4548713.1 ATP-grasp ribosomal peptide maturase [Streptomyces sp. NBC_01500]
MRAARPVLVVAERLDASADMVVDQLNQRDVPVMRFDSADFPQHVTLSAGHRPTDAGWEGVLSDEHRSVRLEDVRAVYYRRPGRPVIADTVAEPYATWAQNQADAAMLNLLSALPVRWINNPHHDRIAAHKPQQLVAATRAGLRVPSSIITNDPSEARAFAKTANGPLICKPVLGGRLDTGEGRQLMVATHRVDPVGFDDSIRLTAHYFQEDIPKQYEVRLVVVDGNLFAGTITGTSEKARTDWRTDYENLRYGTTTVPDKVATAVRRFMTSYGIVFGSFDFAVTPDDEWVFFENNPAGTWSWVENHTGLPIAAAHADYLQGTTT